jgi:hypothetical protein
LRRRNGKEDTRKEEGEKKRGNEGGKEGKKECIEEGEWERRNDSGEMRRKWVTPSNSRSVERWSACKQLVDDATERPQIRTSKKKITR